MNKIFVPSLPKPEFPEVKPGDMVELRNSHGRVFCVCMVYSHNGHNRSPRDLRLLQLDKGKPWCLNNLWTELTPSQVSKVKKGVPITITTSVESKNDELP